MRLWTIALFLTIGPSPVLAQTLALPPSVVESEPVQISASGLEPGKQAALVVRRITADGTSSESRSVFLIGSDGILDPARDTAIGGDYEGQDAAGPFWSMRPVDRDARDLSRLLVKIEIEGATVAEAQTAWVATPDGIGFEDIPEFAGARLYRPAAIQPLPIIIVLSGSDGGSRSSRRSAARLAALGYAALALPYYNPSWSGEDLPGLPQAFADIPVDRLETVKAWISGRPDLDDERIGLYGVSKGGEFALLAASRFPWLRAVAAIVPSDVVWEGWGTGDPDGSRSSFAWRGQPLPHVPYRGMTAAIAAISRGERRTLAGPHMEGRRHSPMEAAMARIPVERYCGDLLVVGGDQDMTWASGAMARTIAERRAESGLATVLLTFADAGHSLSDTGWSPINYPGNEATAAASASAQRQVWQTTKTFFAQSIGRDQPVASPTC